LLLLESFRIFMQTLKSQKEKIEVVGLISGKNADGEVVDEEAPKNSLAVAKTPETSLLFRGLVIAGLIGQKVCFVTLTQYSQSTLIGNEIRYRATTAVLLTEVLKMLIGIFGALFFGDIRECVSGFWEMSIPALLYVVQNNLIFLALACLDSCVFQVVYQLKILTTAFFLNYGFGQKSFNS